MSIFKVANQSAPMPEPYTPDACFEPLPGHLLPLLNKFYRAHRSPMRSTGGPAWVARRADIIAALNLTSVAGGHWLTGLFSAPSERGKGMATRLLAATLAEQREPVWLFCDASLLAFYARLGFQSCDSLPASLADRLARYRRHRALHALQWQPQRD